MATSDASSPAPTLFFDTVNAYQRTAVLKGAIDLGLFTAIAEGATVASDIAGRCNASPRGVRILCDFLVVNGFLTKRDNRYALTADSAMFLDRRSPAYLGGAIDFLLSEPIVGPYRDVAAFVRKGGTTLPDQGTTGPEAAVRVKFARGMAPLMAPAAQALAALADPDASEPINVLDI